MQKIDKAELLDHNTGAILTPFGVTSIYELSTGCKTVLNGIYVRENPDVYPSIKAINATECGWNAVEALFEYVENSVSELAVVIEHDNELYKCKERNYLLNGKEQLQSMFEFYLE